MSCGQEFYGYTPASKFCSPLCYSNFRHQQAAELNKQTKICERCGKEFGPRSQGENRWRSPKEFAARRFCSRECSGHLRRNTIDDLLKKIVVNKQTGCHIWVGATIHNGYGQAKLDNRWVMVHRAVWEHYKGPIPEGLQIDHTCMVRNCCNVEHLRMVTSQINNAASNNACAVHLRKPYCPTCGGEYTVRPNGSRYCKPCWLRWQTEYQRKYRARKWKEEEYCQKQAAYRRKYRVRKREEAGVTDKTLIACPVCGGPYSLRKNGAKYCPPCHKKRQRESYLRYVAKKKQEEKET